MVLRSKEGKFQGDCKFTDFMSDSVITTSVILSSTIAPLPSIQSPSGGKAFRNGFLNWRVKEKNENEQKLVKYPS